LFVHAANESLTGTTALVTGDSGGVDASSIRRHVPVVDGGLTVVAPQFPSDLTDLDTEGANR
jgi:hypothetical protein